MAINEPYHVSQHTAPKVMYVPDLNTVPAPADTRRRDTSLQNQQHIPKHDDNDNHSSPVKFDIKAEEEEKKTTG